MPHDPHENGRVASTEVDSYGDVVSNLSDVPEALLPKVQGNQPGGLLCRPLDKDARCVYTADGDTCEVQALRSRRAIQALHKRAGEIPKGATRLHSMGNAPDMVQVRDSEILLGVGAVDYAIKGTTYRNAEHAANTPIITAIMTTLNAVPAAADLATAITLANACKAALMVIGNSLKTLEDNRAQYLSALVKVK